MQGPLEEDFHTTHKVTRWPLLDARKTLCAERIIEGSLEVKLPTIWTDGKAEVGRVRE